MKCRVGSTTRDPCSYRLDVEWQLYISTTVSSIGVCMTLTATASFKCDLMKLSNSKCNILGKYKGMMKLDITGCDSYSAMGGQA